jgi:hypothetical protein
MPDEPIRKRGLWPLYLAAMVAMVCSFVVGHLVAGRLLAVVLTVYTILAATGLLVYSLRSESASGATAGRAGGLAATPLIGLTCNMPFGPSMAWIMASAMILGTSYALGRRIRKAGTAS